MVSGNILLLEGIGDYSIISKQKVNVPSNYLLLLGNIIRQHLNYKVHLINCREIKFNSLLLNTYIDENKPDIIIVNLDCHNFKNIENLVSKLSINKIILFTYEFKLLPLIKEINSRKYDSIFFDEKKSFSENYNIIINKLFPKADNYKFRYDYKFWDFINFNNIYNIEISIGTGCQRKCQYCEINSSKIEQNSPYEVFKEIQYLIISKGVKYFHINSHNFTYNHNLVKKICSLITNKLVEYDFGWSCFIIPEEIIKYKNMLPLLNAAKAERIELDLGHVNKSIQDYYNIDIDLKEFSNLVEQAYKQGFSSIVVNYLIGSEIETQNSLNELLKYSKELLDLAPGVIEFNLDLYFEGIIDDNIVESKLESTNQTYLTSLKNSSKLSKVNIMEFKNRFNKFCLLEMDISLKNTNILQRIKHIKLAEKGFCTQYYLYFISKSATFSIHKMRFVNSELKYSWEITDDIFNYTPIIFTKYAYLNSNKVIFVNKKYTNEQYIQLDDYYFDLYSLAKEYSNLYNMINYMSDKYIGYNIEQNKSLILNFFFRLEKSDMLLFTKCIN